MSKLPFNARGHLSTPAARDAARQKQAEQAHQEVDAEKVTLEERMAELRAKRLAQQAAGSWGVRNDTIYDRARRLREQGS